MLILFIALDSLLLAQSPQTFMRTREPNRTSFITINFETFRATITELVDSNYVEHKMKVIHFDEKQIILSPFCEDENLEISIGLKSRELPECSPLLNIIYDRNKQKNTLTYVTNGKRSKKKYHLIDKPPREVLNSPYLKNE